VTGGNVGSKGRKRQKDVKEECGGRKEGRNEGK
jgi:hypothetical protein